MQLTGYRNILYLSGFFSNVFLIVSETFEYSTSYDNSSIRGESGEKLTIEINLKEKRCVMDLHLVEKNQANNEFLQGGGPSVMVEPEPEPEPPKVTVKPDDALPCHYAGKIRNVNNSKVIVNKCNALSGTIFDGRGTYSMANFNILESGNHSILEELIVHNLDNKPDMYFTCGDTDPDVIRRTIKERSIQHEQNFDLFYNATYFIRMALVYDHKLYVEMDRNSTTLLHRYIEVINSLNELFKEFKIFIFLAAFCPVIPTSRIVIDDDIDKTLESFGKYALNVMAFNPRINYMHLITNQLFTSKLASRGSPHQMCGPANCGVTNAPVDRSHRFIVSNLAQVIALNFGVPYEEEGSECTPPQSIMRFHWPRSLIWSNCSKRAFEKLLDASVLSCLYYKPSRNSIERECYITFPREPISPALLWLIGIAFAMLVLLCCARIRHRNGDDEHSSCDSFIPPRVAEWLPRVNELIPTANPFCGTARKESTAYTLHPTSTDSEDITTQPEDTENTKLPVDLHQPSSSSSENVTEYNAETKSLINSWQPILIAPENITIHRDSEGIEMQCIRPQPVSICMENATTLDIAIEEAGKQLSPPPIPTASADDIIIIEEGIEEAELQPYSLNLISSASGNIVTQRSPEEMDWQSITPSPESDSANLRQVLSTISENISMEDGGAEGIAELGDNLPLDSFDYPENVSRPDGVLVSIETELQPSTYVNPWTITSAYNPAQTVSTDSQNLPQGVSGGMETEASTYFNLWSTTDTENFPLLDQALEEMAKLSLTSDPESIVSDLLPSLPTDSEYLSIEEGAAEETDFGLATSNPLLERFRPLDNLARRDRNEPTESLFRPSNPRLAGYENFTVEEEEHDQDTKQTWESSCNPTRPLFNYSEHSAWRKKVKERLNKESETFSLESFNSSDRRAPTSTDPDYGFIDSGAVEEIVELDSTASNLAQVSSNYPENLATQDGASENTASNPESILSDLAQSVPADVECMPKDEEGTEETESSHSRRVRFNFPEDTTTSDENAPERRQLFSSTSESQTSEALRNLSWTDSENFSAGDQASDEPEFRPVTPNPSRSGWRDPQNVSKKNKGIKKTKSCDVRSEDEFDDVFKEETSDSDSDSVAYELRKSWFTESKSISVEDESELLLGSDESESHVPVTANPLRPPFTETEVASLLETALENTNLLSINSSRPQAKRKYSENDATKDEGGEGTQSDSATSATSSGRPQVKRKHSENDVTEEDDEGTHPSDSATSAISSSRPQIKRRNSTIGAAKVEGGEGTHQLDSATSAISSSRPQIKRRHTTIGAAKDEGGEGTHQLDSATSAITSSRPQVKRKYSENDATEDKGSKKTQSASATSSPHQSLSNYLESVATRVEAIERTTRLSIDSNPESLTSDFRLAQLSTDSEIASMDDGGTEDARLNLTASSSFASLKDFWETVTTPEKTPERTSRQHSIESNPESLASDRRRAQLSTDSETGGIEGTSLDSPNPIPRRSLPSYSQENVVAQNEEVENMERRGTTSNTRSVSSHPRQAPSVESENVFTDNEGIERTRPRPHSFQALSADSSNVTTQDEGIVEMEMRTAPSESSSSHTASSESI